jgi:hypothetical protein
MYRCCSIAVAILAACGTDLAMPGTNVSPSSDPPPPDAAGEAGSGSGSIVPCDPATAPADLAFVQQRVFTPSCALSHCHDAGAAADLDLRAGFARDSLVAMASTTQSGWVRVVPGDPAASYLGVAIGGEPGPRPEDGIMPLGAPALCAGKIAAIIRWIAAGAGD